MTRDMLIEHLKTLDPDTKILIWREESNGYYDAKLSDLDEAKQYGDQYLRAKGGDVKFVAVF